MQQSMCKAWWHREECWDRGCECLGRNGYIRSESVFPSGPFFFYSSTHSLSQLSSQWIFTLDFWCSPGGPLGNWRQGSQSDENVHRRSREERPGYRQNLFGKLSIKRCFGIHVKVSQSDSINVTEVRKASRVYGADWSTSWPEFIFSCGTDLKVKPHSRSPLQTTYIPSRRFSRSAK